MRSKPVNHEMHEKVAVFALLLTLVIAAAAFYYVWKVNASIGRTIEGTRALGEIMYKRALKEQMAQQEYPAAVQDFQAKNGCCIYIESLQLGSQLKYDVLNGSTGLCTDHIDASTKERIKMKEMIIVDIEDKECQKNIR